MTNRQWYSVLALAGAAPFVACALLMLMGITELGPLGDVRTVAVSYGFGIVAFLCGIHWATRLYGLADHEPNLFLTSNILFLVVWLAWLGLGIDAALLALVLALVALYLIDRRLHAASIIDRHYLQVRGIATVLAAVSLAVVRILPG